MILNGINNNNNYNYNKPNIYVSDEIIVQFDISTRTLL